MTPVCWTIADDAVFLTIRVTPRASRNAIEGIIAVADGRHALAVRVTSPPVEGEANHAVIALLAEKLGMRRGDLAIVSGDTGRLKRVRIAGDPTAITARLVSVL